MMGKSKNRKKENISITSERRIFFVGHVLTTVFTFVVPLLTYKVFQNDGHSHLPTSLDSDISDIFVHFLTFLFILYN